MMSCVYVKKFSSFCCQWSSSCCNLSVNVSKKPKNSLICCITSHQLVWVELHYQDKIIHALLNIVPLRLRGRVEIHINKLLHSLLNFVPMRLRGRVEIHLSNSFTQQIWMVPNKCIDRDCNQSFIYLSAHRITVLLDVGLGWEYIFVATLLLVIQNADIS